MADIELVIKIPEEKYQTIINHTEEILDESSFIEPKYLYRAVLDGTPLPDNPTNGDMIKALFDCKLEDEFSISYLFKIENNRYCTQFDKKWWNAPYKLSKQKGK